MGEDGLNNDLSNLTLVGPETQAKLEALLEAAGRMFHSVTKVLCQGEPTLGKCEKMSFYYDHQSTIYFLQRVLLLLLSF